MWPKSQHYVTVPTAFRGPRMSMCVCLCVCVCTLVGLWALKFTTTRGRAPDFSHREEVLWEDFRQRSVYSMLYTGYVERPVVSAFNGVSLRGAL